LELEKEEDNVMTRAAIALSTMLKSNYSLIKALLSYIQFDIQVNVQAMLDEYL
jgi:hypothetical protein